MTTSDLAAKLETRWIESDRDRAPLLVFLHEGLGSVAMWRDFPDRLCKAAGVRGLVYSRPGYGQSPPRLHGQRWTPAFLHEQAQQILPALLAACGIDAVRDPVWLFGHSDGGSIALLFAAAYPQFVQGAVVLAPHLFVEDVSVTSIAGARTAYVETDLRSKLARYHADVDSAFWGWNDVWLDPAFRHWNIEPEVSAIRCPVLAIQGVNDEYGTMQQIDRIAELAMQAELLKLPDCGHSPHRDQPVKVIEATTQWLARHAAARRGA